MLIMEQALVERIAVLLIAISFSSIAGNSLEITTPAGTFQGIVQSSLQGQLYKAYMGIPYALPPIGELRFAKPKPYPKINGVYNATKQSPICIQPAGVDLGSPAQEDCLYLNVYLPMDNNGRGAGTLKKVFVYIHGGGFFMGSTREYVPGDLVALGDMIVVTMNYRLSWLGFLKGNTSELPGNQGLWDQLIALTWVKANIWSFGGDPTDITLGGNSMGGESVSAWSIVAPGKDLFTKGFIMSGTMFACPSKPDSSDVLLDLLTDRVGCKDEDTRVVVQCLRELPAEKFILPVEGWITNKFTTIDGELFPAVFETLISDKEYLKSVGFYDRDFLLTMTSNEGEVEFTGPFNIGADPVKIPAEYLSQRFHVPIAVAEKIVAWYKQPGHFSYKPGHDIICDPMMGIPTFQFLEAFAEVNGTAGKSYFLWFDHQPGFLPSDFEGLGHGLDLTYLFDMHPNKMLWDYYHTLSSKDLEKTDYELKKLYIGMLVDFMKYGDPSLTISKKFSIQWPAFDLKSEKYLSFGPKPFVDQFPLKERRHFWNVLYPQYKEEYRKSQLREEL